MKMLVPVAVILVAAVPCWYAWQAKVTAAERRMEQEMNDEVQAAFERHLEQAEREQWRDAKLSLMKRHERERDAMTRRHEQVELADRISENLRPGSTRHHGTHKWDEFSEMRKRQDQEMKQWERENPEP